MSSYAASISGGSREGPPRSRISRIVQNRVTAHVAGSPVWVQGKFWRRKRLARRQRRQEKWSKEKADRLYVHQFFSPAYTGGSTAKIPPELATAHATSYGF